MWILQCLCVIGFFGSFMHCFPTTKIPGQCFYQGKVYAPGMKIESGNNGKGWCWGVVCDLQGNPIPWDNFKCATSKPSSFSSDSPTPEPTTTEPTTTEPTTTEPTTTEPTTTKPTTTEPTTTEPTTTEPTTTEPPTTEPGCIYKGKHYTPGEVINTGRSDNWCFGTICDEEGSIMMWDNFECSTTSIPSTTFETTTEFPTTETTTKPDGCFYNGKYYPEGEIESGKDGDCTWGTYCDSDGGVATWDGYGCFYPITDETTSSPPSPTSEATQSTEMVKEVKIYRKRAVLRPLVEQDE